MLLSPLEKLRIICTWKKKKPDQTELPTDDTSKKNIIYISETHGGKKTHTHYQIQYKHKSFFVEINLQQTKIIV